MKALSRQQLAELNGSFNLDTNWSAIDPDNVQARFIEQPKEERGRQWTAFLNNGGRLIIKGPSVLVIDRSKPFDPTRFLGTGSSIWRGSADGKGLEGEEDQDPRSVVLTELDFSNVAFDSFLKEGEPTIVGEEKLVRMKASPRIRYDAGAGVALLDEKGQATLRFLYDTYGITWMEFATVLRYSDGLRYLLVLRRGGGGSWGGDGRWLGGVRDAGRVSPVSAS
ncbi:MAG: hypothetical protein AAB665_01120 [Patescibacteria group bacterium]